MVFFRGLSKSCFESYGIENPQSNTIGGEVFRGLS